MNAISKCDSMRALHKELRRLCEKCQTDEVMQLKFDFMRESNVTIEESQSHNTALCPTSKLNL
jgi:hypothetical protein